MTTVREYVIVPDPDDDNPDSMPIFEGTVDDAPTRLIPGVYPCEVVYEFDDDDDTVMPGVLFVGPIAKFPVSLGMVWGTFVSIDPCVESPCDVGTGMTPCAPDNGPHSHTGAYFVGYPA